MDLVSTLEMLTNVPVPQHLLDQVVKVNTRMPVNLWSRLMARMFASRGLPLTMISFPLFQRSYTVLITLAKITEHATISLITTLVTAYQVLREISAKVNF